MEVILAIGLIVGGQVKWYGFWKMELGKWVSRDRC